MSNVPHRPRPSYMCFPVGAIWEGPGNTALLEEVHYWLDLESHRQAPILVCTLPCFRLKVASCCLVVPAITDSPSEPSAKNKPFYKLPWTGYLPQ